MILIEVIFKAMTTNSFVWMLIQRFQNFRENIFSIILFVCVVVAYLKQNGNNPVI